VGGVPPEADRFCQYFWCKIYAKGGGLYNLDQNRMAPIFTKTEEHYVCGLVFCILQLVS